jgi:hypothetical protein
MLCRSRLARPRVRVPGGQVVICPEWDDLRPAGLKLIFLMVSRAVSVLGLSRRESWWKDAEILMVRHQLAVAQRERPRAGSHLAWPDRAWLALLAGTLPAGRLARCAITGVVAPAAWACQRAADRAGCWRPSRPRAARAGMCSAGRT